MTRRSWRWMLVAAVVLPVVAVGGGVAFVYSGFYNVAATRQHTAPVYGVLVTALRESVRTHAAREIVAVPDLGDPARASRGIQLYAEHCVICHGAPGVAPDALALGMTPPPSNLVGAGRDHRPRELYWAVARGLKMTGMPAWEFRLGEEELWDVVAFLETLPRLSPEAYQQWRERAAEPASRSSARSAGVAPAAPPDPDRGQVAIRQYACQTCHLIPGVTGADAIVGPPLNRMAARRSLAGLLPNTTEALIRWIRHPQQVDPRSAMPDLGVSERDARDIAAYLETLR